MRVSSLHTRGWDGPKCTIWRAEINFMPPSIQHLARSTGSQYGELERRSCRATMRAELSEEFWDLVVRHCAEVVRLDLRLPRVQVFLSFFPACRVEASVHSENFGTMHDLLPH